MNRWKRLSGRFEPPGLDAADQDGRRRADLLVLSTVAIVPWGIIFAIPYGMADVRLGVVLASAAVVAALCPWTMRRFGHFAGATLLVACVDVCAFTVGLCSGGVHSSAVAWYVFLILAGGLIGGTRAAFGWLFVGGAQLLFMWWLSANGLAPPNVVPESMSSTITVLTLFGLYIATCSVVFAFEYLRKRVARELQQTTDDLVQARERADAANHAKSEFLATMFHEVRTPMSGVIGAASLLRTTALSDEQATLVDTMELSGRSLLELLNDVLDFSKIEQGYLELIDEDYALTQLIGDVEAIYRPAAGLGGTDLHTDISGLDIPTLRGPRSRLRQVLNNLVGNAVKFTKSGRIEIRAALTERPQVGLRLRVEVEDTGPGVDPATSSRLFDAFTQADGGSTRRYGGTGLGLAICRQLISAMGGDIGVESDGKYGSVFWFEIPTEQGAEIAEQSDAPSTFSVVSRHILLAEDDPLSAMLGIAMLTKLGCTVHHAVDGRAAIEAAKAGGFDLVLMDFRMPEVDGLMACREIRKLSSLAAVVPIVALTANATAEDRQAAADAGMSGFLTKPITLEQLHDALRRFIRPPSDPNLQVRDIFR
ncbi:MAG: signal transduction histidine kinase/ActR/RegA family two-component response regulator [Myxococcota bacterium]|jgi:signal transduction histidine kinase/ActR/RegA family two-component response regulator